MNSNLIFEFTEKLRNKFVELNVELSKSNIDATTSLEIIKVLRRDISHVYNLLKIEEEVQKKDK